MQLHRPSLLPMSIVPIAAKSCAKTMVSRVVRKADSGTFFVFLI